MEINKDLFVKYAEIKTKIKELEEEAKMIAPTIMEMIDSTEEGRIESDFGKFSVMSRKSYKYSEPTVALANELKRRQEEEVATGEAKFTESRSVRFDSIKGEE
jgi:nucleoid DNA-binding protein